jgi:hypothetical protein
VREQDLDSVAFAVEPGVLGPVVGLEAAGVEPAGIVDIVVEVAGIVDMAVENTGVAYTAYSYHNTIDHTAEYISFDLDILDMCSFCHLYVIQYYLAN